MNVPEQEARGGARGPPDPGPPCAPRHGDGLTRRDPRSPSGVSVANTCENMGVVYPIQGDYEMALFRYQNAPELFKTWCMFAWPSRRRRRRPSNGCNAFHGNGCNGHHPAGSTWQVAVLCRPRTARRAAPRGRPITRTRPARSCGGPALHTRAGSRPVPSPRHRGVAATCRDAAPWSESALTGPVCPTPAAPSPPLPLHPSSSPSLSLSLSIPLHLHPSLHPSPSLSLHPSPSTSLSVSFSIPLPLPVS